VTSSLLILRSLRLYWRTALVVALGVAIATAVITGSLLVGDSVTASVRQTALTRLGLVEYALPSPHFLRADLVDELRAALQDRQPGLSMAGVLSVPGTARNVQTDAVIPRVQVIGVDDRFAALFSPRPLALEGRDAAVNATLARDLGLAVGDFILVHARRREAEPGGSLFARREQRDVMGRMRLRVTEILADEYGGAFAPARTTAPPRNVFVAIDWLARELGEPDTVNLILAAGATEVAALQEALGQSVGAKDYGFSLVAHEPGPLVSVFSQRLAFLPGQVDAIRRAARRAGAEAALTSIYLADTLRNTDTGAEAAYAVVAGLEELDPLPIAWGSRTLTDTDIRLNHWMAEDLQAAIGDTIELSYLVSRADGTYGTETLSRSLRGIVAMEGAAADPKLVPEFRGITEAETVADWDPPFPLDLGRVTARDDTYWDLYRAAPKAYVSLQTVRAMWQAGHPDADAAPWITSVRIRPPGAMDPSDFRARFLDALREEIPPQQAGLGWQPVRHLALAAAEGSQDYGMLFVSMSFFIVLAAAGLAGMLMRLSVQHRASQLGLLLACGFTRKRAAGVLLWEGAILALAGTLSGLPLGIAYAGGILALLRSGIFGGIGEVELWLFLHPPLLALGAAVGFPSGWVATWLGVRSLKRAGTLDLLAGWQAMNTMPRGRRPAVMWILVLVAATALLWSVWTGSTAGFFLTGFFLLVAGLAVCHALLSSMGARARRSARTRLTLPLLAARGASLNTGRSMLVIGLLAGATFVITSVSAFTRDYARVDASDRASGTGGFTLRAVASIPVPYDFGQPGGRESLGFTSEDEPLFDGVRVAALLANEGDDVSCLNLARPDTPRLLGVDRAMMDRGGFGVRTATPHPEPWLLLDAEPDNGRIPVFGDADSVRWQLHLDLGDTLSVQGPDGTPVELELVGLIPFSIFAGELLMSDTHFRRLYPREDHPRYFLLETPADRREEIADTLRRNLGGLGVDVTATRDILNAVAGVQNTYIATFLALGGLGILLGSFGLVIVLLRSALERRGEEALQLALGFSRSMPSTLLALENGGLLVAGMACGLLAAWPAVMLQMRQTEIAINWGLLVPVLAGILIVGLAACVLAARLAVRGNLIALLRGE